MARGIGKIQAKSGHIKQRKRENKTKTLKSEKMISKGQKGLAAGKSLRSYGIQSKKKFPIWSQQIANLDIANKGGTQSGLLQMELLETELAEVKEKLRASAESLLAARETANQTREDFELLTATRNQLMDNFIREQNKLLELKEAEVVLMSKLGFL